MAAASAHCARSSRSTTPPRRGEASVGSGGFVFDAAAARSAQPGVATVDDVREGRQDIGGTTEGTSSISAERFSEWWVIECVVTCANPLDLGDGVMQDARCVMWRTVMLPGIRLRSSPPTRRLVLVFVTNNDEWQYYVIWCGDLGQTANQQPTIS